MKDRSDRAASLMQPACQYKGITAIVAGASEYQNWGRAGGQRTSQLSGRCACSLHERQLGVPAFNVAHLRAEQQRRKPSGDKLLNRHGPIVIVRPGGFRRAFRVRM